MLDPVGQPDPLAVDLRRRQRQIEDPARRTDEGALAPRLLLARPLPDEDDPGLRVALAPDDRRARFVG